MPGWPPSEPRWLLPLGFVWCHPPIPDSDKGKILMTSAYWLIFGCGLLAILYGIYAARAVLSADPGSDRMREIAGAIQEGANAFLNRQYRAISVVGVVIGALFLRTFRDGQAFTDADIRFFQIVGSLTAKVLRNAYRYERMAQRQSETSELARQANLERVALVAYLKRLLTIFSKQDGTGSEGLLSETAADELDRLAEVTMTVLQEEGKAH